MLIYSSFSSVQRKGKVYTFFCFLFFFQWFHIYILSSTCRPFSIGHVMQSFVANIFDGSMSSVI
uniref:Uncharacterized protein n=1 Tax=Anguilla anguilla TaxID=7936 RepID=A0A0E9X2I9_ANGAN